MNKEEFKSEIKKVYDNLTKEQFKELVVATHNKLIKQVDKNMNIICRNQYEQMAFNIFELVIRSKKISFKQFQVLSAYTKTNWIKKEEQEFKQF